MRERRKKKEDPGGQPPAAPEPVEVAIPEVSENGIYSIGQWNGLPQWRCIRCAWDTLESEDAMLRHYQDRHMTIVQPAPKTLPVYDRWGNQVQAR